MSRLRATTSTGAVLDEPSAAQLLALVREIDGTGSGAFLIVESGADPSGQTYLQALSIDGAYLVEYRAGSPDEHFRADAPNAAVVGAVVTSWAARTSSWRNAVTWQPVHLTARVPAGR